MDIVYLLVVLLLIGFIGYMVYAKMQRDQRAFNDLYKPVEDDDASDEHDLETYGSISFAGDATFITQNFWMRAGHYTLVYEFPQSVEVTVELKSKKTGDKQVIATTSGDGEVDFTVERDELYYCRIAPAKFDDWEIEIRRGD